MQVTLASVGRPLIAAAEGGRTIKIPLCPPRSETRARLRDRFPPRGSASLTPNFSLSSGGIPPFHLNPRGISVLPPRSIFRRETMMDGAIREILARDGRTTTGVLFGQFFTHLDKEHGLASEIEL